MYKLVLASSSKNRKALLENLNIPFGVDFPMCDEAGIVSDSAITLTQERAKAKAESLLIKYKTQDVVLIGCDTVIEHDGVIFGKPQTANEARDMFCSYQEKSHFVHSSIYCINANTLHSELVTSTSTVFFGFIDDDDLDAYIESEEWRGVSGGYRLQGLASRFIKRIEGSPSGIIGLPIYELHSILKKLVHTS